MVPGQDCKGGELQISLVCRPRRPKLLQRCERGHCHGGGGCLEVPSLVAAPRSWRRLAAGILWCTTATLQYVGPPALLLPHDHYSRRKMPHPSTHTPCPPYLP